MSDAELKRAGWKVAAALLMAWAGWLSLSVLANTETVGRVEERQQNQFQQLRDDIAEIKELIKE